MKAQELRSLTNAELANRLDDYYQEMFNLRFQKTIGQLTNSARFGQVRKEIARIKTILRERQLAVETVEEW